MNNIQKEQTLYPNDFTSEFYLVVKENILYNPSLIIQTEGTLPNSSYQVIKILILKPYYILTMNK